NIIRSFFCLYSIVRVGIRGCGLSFSVESSLEGWPHRDNNNSASFVAVDSLTLGSAVLLRSPNDLITANKTTNPTNATKTMRQLLKSLSFFLGGACVAFAVDLACVSVPQLLQNLPTPSILEPQAAQ